MITSGRLCMAKRKITGFAARLRQLREAAGLTQAELAERAGLHLHGLTKLEQGYREPAWSTVKALAKALGTDCLAFEDEAEDGSGTPQRPRGRPAKREEPPAPAKKPRPKGRK